MYSVSYLNYKFNTFLIVVSKNTKKSDLPAASDKNTVISLNPDGLQSYIEIQRGCRHHLRTSCVPCYRFVINRDKPLAASDENAKDRTKENTPAITASFRIFLNTRYNSISRGVMVSGPILFTESCNELILRGLLLCAF